MDKDLIETRADGVATLTLNRPDRLNALSTPIMEGLLEALPRLAGRSLHRSDRADRGRARVLRGRRRQAHGRGNRPAQQRRGRGPAARPHGNLAAAARNPQTHHRDGERPGGRRRARHGARVRHAHRRSVRALRHGVREGRVFRRLRRQLLPLQAGRDRQGARTLLHGRAARRRAGLVIGHREPGRSGRGACRCTVRTSPASSRRGRASRSA